MIDGNSILNRGFFGVPLLTDNNGNYTNAVLGFMNISLKVIEETKPDYLIVAFDVHAPTFRHKMFDAYKGTRKPMADELKSQLPIIREVLSALNVKCVEMAGYEADDLLGTLAKRYMKEGLDVVVLSGDRDLLQISDERIMISIPKTFGGKTEVHNYFPKDFIAEYGVTPLEFIDVKALQGDSSDNIPGVKNVGPKTAVELIAKYHNLEGLYENIDEVTKKALHENLVNDKETAFMCRDLARIEINAPISVDISECTISNMLNPASLEVLTKYSLNMVINKLENLKLCESGSVSRELTSYEYKNLTDFADVDTFLRNMQNTKLFAIAGCDDGVGIYDGKKAVFISEGGFVTKDYLKKAIKDAAQSADCVVCHRIKDSYEYLDEYLSDVASNDGVRNGGPGNTSDFDKLMNKLDDIELMEYLVDPLRGDYPISHIADKYLNRYYGEQKELDEKPVERCVISAIVSFDAASAIRERLKELDETKLYRDIEMPLSYVLYNMEREGILVDSDELASFSIELSAGIDELAEKIYDAAGEKFNINSPKQLGEILFGKLNLPGGKKTKSGYSTAADVLEKLAETAPIVKDILQYRQLTKLKSTYAEGLQNFICEDGRIHSHFNQTITATGRISSTEPNLQNIPIRTELGSRLRKVFYAKANCVLIDADYSQIELRLMAHMSNDEGLIEAYRSNKDIHRTTASQVFHKPFEEVTESERRNAKAVNFGIIYGISSYGLSQDLSISVKEAKAYIDDYLKTYPKVHEFMKNIVESAKESGSTRTLYNRIRPIPELKASNFMQRSFGERVAMNSPIQGTAADIMKIAMINIFKRMRNEGLKAKMLIQVHDEVLIETPNDEIEKVKRIVQEEMIGAANLRVPLEASLNMGTNWYDAK